MPLVQLPFASPIVVLGTLLDAMVARIRAKRSNVGVGFTAIELHSPYDVRRFGSLGQGCVNDFSTRSGVIAGPWSLDDPQFFIGMSDVKVAKCVSSYFKILEA